MRMPWGVLLALAACSVDSNGFPSGVTAATAPESASGIESASQGTTDSGTTSGTTSGGTAAVDDSGTTSTTGDSGGTTMAIGPSSSSSGGGSSESTGLPAECMGAPLDPQLFVPPMCSPTCTSIGFGNDCPAAEVCRLEDSVTAVCEGCSPCGNLHDPCTASNQCDILFTCFMGQCTPMCDLTTPQTCGNPAACTDVGHITHGVCNPNL